jgi:hypothetical protein
MFWPTVCRPVCPGIKHPPGAYDQILITVRQLWVCWCGAFSLTRGWVCCLQLILALASAVILGSESLGTRNHIFTVSDSRFPFSSPPTTRRAMVEVMQLSHRPHTEHCFTVSPLTCVRNLLPSNGHCLKSHYLATGQHARLCSVLTIHQHGPLGR